MDYAIYENTLSKRILTIGVLSAIFAVAFMVIFLVQVIKRRKKEKMNKWAKKYKLMFGELICLAMTIFCLAIGGKYVLPYSYDLHNKAYLKWEGDFTIVHHGKNHSFVYIPDENGIKLDGGRSLPEGMYSGMIVYGQHSRIVLEYCIDGVRYLSP